MQPALQAEHVYYTYSDGAEALKDVSLDIAPRQIFVLFGPARSGKTTLLRLFNRLSDLIEGSAIRGSIRFNGQDVFEHGVNVPDLRRRIGMVFAVPSPLPGSIHDNMTYGLKMAGIRDAVLREERVERALKQAALWDEVKDRLDNSAFALSGGQKQRLCIARSLALEPDVLILDNPTSGLDPLSTSMVEESLHELKQRYTIIMVPHSVQQAARVATHAAFMLDGEVIEVGDVSQIFGKPHDQRTEDYVTGRFG
ncbi:MAG TPA: phosphate ABC transporter ATP-binding protein [Aggregatilinea sp.]|uniref:phosphate ABC transporter ATP-binding protein n=1 Tax=Aggregatilinea sp. TaxID=2806333 RepID=UPI002B9CF32A|nr:phosphate ABC transporter ATP-binding protein [Aggregatilinea sp.]HML22885.1 phosphate ABC transporter ATP-binding protein [Aggregatilinea sp.]